MKHTLSNQTLAIMQPYFLPYIGYFQLINAVDTFVVYDNIEYSKKAWVNKNRFLQNNAECLFSLPLKKDSDFLHIDRRVLSEDFKIQKLLDRIHFAYKKAPNHKHLMPLVESILYYPRNNLFDFVYHSILLVCNYLGIRTNFVISSNVNIKHNLKAGEKVLALCKALNAKTYINPIGGIDLYNEDVFKNNQIELYFLQTKEIFYRQLSDVFIPNLSIIDVIAFNDIVTIKQMLSSYLLIKELV